MKALKPLLLVSIFALTACGGGGGGSSSSGEAKKDGAEQVKPTTPVTTGSASKGTVSGYTYTAPNGKTYALRNSVINSAGKTVMRDASGTLVTCCGAMSYTTYGTWTSGTDSAVFHTSETATAAANVPTQGSATYAGNALRGTELNSASFNVDFAAKTVSGSVASGAEFGPAVSMEGNITGGTFSGTAVSDGNSGVFSGQFNGATAQELGGVAQFSDASKDIAFGATRQ